MSMLFDDIFLGIFSIKSKEKKLSLTIARKIWKYWRVII